MTSKKKKSTKSGNGSNGHPVFHPWEVQQVPAEPRPELPSVMEEYHLDCRGQKRLFRLELRDAPPLLDALEIRDGQPTGWRFKERWTPDLDMPPYYAIRQKIAERLATRDLVRDPDTGRLTVLDWKIRAQVSYAEEEEPGPPVIVDGEVISWTELGEMLKSYEGWGLRIEITEQGEE